MEKGKNSLLLGSFGVKQKGLVDELEGKVLVKKKHEEDL